MQQNNPKYTKKFASVFIFLEVSVLRYKHYRLTRAVLDSTGL